LLGRQIAKHVTGLLVVSSHARRSLENRESIVVRLARSVDPLSFTFSAAC
jgi:hypothetical protein